MLNDADPRDLSRRDFLAKTASSAQDWLSGRCRGPLIGSAKVIDKGAAK